MNLIKLVVEKYRAGVRRWQWRKDPTKYLRSMGVQVGENCRIYGCPHTVFDSEPYLVRLGNHVSITSGVRFITHDGGVWVFREQHPTMDVFGPIVVGSNVFIGINTIILPNVTIGDNCVIGAGSVVTRNIPSNSVAAGNPARVIRPLNEYLAKCKQRAVYERDASPQRLREFLEHRYIAGGNPPAQE